MHVFYFREAWRSFQHHRGLAYTAIFSLTAALTLCGLFLLFAHNANQTLHLVGDRREMVIYLNDGVSNEDRDALLERLKRLYGHPTYVSKEDAWREFTERIGDPALLEAIEGNPLPASIRLQLRPELLSFEAMEVAVRQVKEFPEVEDVRFGGEWVRRLDEIGLALRRGAWVVGLTVALAVMFILYNTIRLTVLARRPQVEIMSRLGASDRFIAIPFVIEAMLEAVLATALALAILLVFQQTFFSQVVHIAFLPGSWIGAFLAAAALLAWVTASVALVRVVRSVGA